MLLYLHPFNFTWDRITRSLFTLNGRVNSHQVSQMLPLTWKCIKYGTTTSLCCVVITMITFRHIHHHYISSLLVIMITCGIKSAVTLDTDSWNRDGDGVFRDWWAFIHHIDALLSISHGRFNIWRSSDRDWVNKCDNAAKCWKNTNRHFNILKKSSTSGGEGSNRVHTRHQDADGPLGPDVTQHPMLPAVTSRVIERRWKKPVQRWFLPRHRLFQSCCYL